VFGYLLPSTRTPVVGIAVMALIPIGMNLFLASSRFDKPLLRVYRDTVPFLVILALGVLVITYVPEMSLGVLKLVGKTDVAAGTP